MFHRIREYDLLHAKGQWYRPRAYASIQSDGTWEGWLVFFPVGGGLPIAPDRETTQSSFDALAYWADGITPTYLEGAVKQALIIDEQPPITAQLASAEHEALQESIAAESRADVEHLRAEAAKTEAEALRAERLATEKVLATAAEVEARQAADIHEHAAEAARRTAAEATETRRQAEQDLSYAADHTTGRGRRSSHRSKP